MHTNAETFTGDPHEELEEVCLIRLVLHRLIAIHEDDHGWFLLAGHFTVEGNSTDPMLREELLPAIQLAVDDPDEFLDFLCLIEQEAIGHMWQLRQGCQTIGSEIKQVHGQIFWALLAS